MPASAGMTHQNTFWKAPYAGIQECDWIPVNYIYYIAK
jgi:hypothetical protein